MKRNEVLDDAKQKVTVERAQDHGNMQDNFNTIAVYWSEHLDCKITANDVGVMMTLLKAARIKSNPYHEDNYVDGAGYFACAAECVDVDG
tara:strand:- start:735 stop:1004 length:270 start_codon:yes stop_codon:yes gene_type:complete